MRDWSADDGYDAIWAEPFDGETQITPRPETAITDADSVRCSAGIDALRARMESEGRLEDARREENDNEAARMHGHAAAVIQDILRQMESAPIARIRDDAPPTP